MFLKLVPREEKRRTRSLPFYYGWIIVAIAFLSTGVWSSMRTTFSVFLVALIDQFHWSRAATAGIQSTSFMVYTVTAPLVGGLIDRFGPKPVILPGIALLCAGLFFCSRVQSLAQFYFFYGVVVALGVTAVSIVAYAAILSHWFEKRRGLASGIAVSGMGIATFFLVPLTQYVVSAAGWRAAFMVLAGLVFILLFPATALFLHHKPADLGLTPDGAVTGARQKKRVEVIDPVWAGTQWTLRRASREGRFWCLLIFCFLSIIPIYLLVTHGMRILIDSGFGRMNAAFLVALVGVVSSMFRIFWGWLSDRIGREITFTMGVTVLSLAALSLIILEGGGSPLWAYLFVLFFGCGWGVTAVTYMAVSADLFQGRWFGMIYGMNEAVIGLGSALGPWVAGFIFDTTGSYRAALIMAMAVCFASCIFVWLSAPRKVRQVKKSLT
jgi:MFS family permease